MPPDLDRYLATVRLPDRDRRRWVISSPSLHGRAALQRHMWPMLVEPFGEGVEPALNGAGEEKVSGTYFLMSMIKREKVSGTY